MRASCDLSSLVRPPWASRARIGSVAFATMLAAGACGWSLAPEDSLEVWLTMEPTVAALGDTIRLLGVAYNPTDTEVPGGVGCTPGIGFYVTISGEPEYSLYDGPFICPFRDNNLIEPNETDSASFSWVPSRRGAYAVRAAVVREGGPRSPSAPSTLTIN